MSIYTRRMNQGWTQEQLAQHAGLSVRTIQRVENGQAGTLETLKCLAAVFETTVSTLMEEQDRMSPTANTTTTLTDAEREAMEYVQDLKGIYLHLVIFGVTILCLFALNLVISPEVLWVGYVIMSWLIGLAIHAAIVFGMFGLFGPEWEQRQFRKRMDRMR